MSSAGFEPTSYGTAVSVANHYTGWATMLVFIRRLIRFNKKQPKTKLGDQSFPSTNLGRVDEEMIPPGHGISQTHHYKGMKIHPDKTVSYIQSKNYPEIHPLTQNHIFERPAFSPRALKLAQTPIMNQPTAGDPL
ncbi:hypothetical protein TNCV_3036221 [Trichonephila clavipes]|nr:hypothetical protein TNCV_3036221 [Trichonephila clavipes]